MNTLYPDLQNKFPQAVDDFLKFTDPSAGQISLINQYYALMESGNTLGAAEILEKNPELRTCILNADRLNLIRDGLISIQRYYLSDVQQYLMELVKNKGEWNNNTRYTKYDVVFYTSGGASQVFMGAEHTIPMGTLPTDKRYFIPLIIQGEKGESGLGMTPRGEWKLETSYAQYDVVSYNEKLWYAKAPSTGKRPSDNPEIWEYISTTHRQIQISAEMPASQSTGDVWIEEIGGGI